MYPPEKIELIVSYLAGGYERCWIAKVTGVSLSTVDRVARGDKPCPNDRGQGVPKEWTPKEVDELVEAYHRGTTQKDLAAQFHASQSSIHVQLKRRGVQLRTREETRILMREVYVPSPDEIAKETERMRKENMETKRLQGGSGRTGADCCGIALSRPTLDSLANAGAFEDIRSW